MKERVKERPWKVKYTRWEVERKRRKKLLNMQK